MRGQRRLRSPARHLRPSGEQLEHRQRAASDEWRRRGRPLIWRAPIDRQYPICMLPRRSDLQLRPAVAPARAVHFDELARRRVAATAAAADAPRPSDAGGAD